MRRKTGRWQGVGSWVGALALSFLWMFGPPPLLGGDASVILLGEITEIPPPPSVQVGDLESNETMFIFLEVEVLILPTDLEVDITVDGFYDDLDDLTPGIIPAGTAVNSWFVHSDVIGIDEGLYTIRLRLICEDVHTSYSTVCE